MNKIVILSTADFDSAVWTNKQHLAVGLAQKHEVVYIESLGLRAPGLSPADLSRIAKKAASLIRRKGSRRSADINSGTSVPDNITVVSPIVLPFHKYGMVRRLNRVLLKRQLASHIRGDADAATLWTFSPLTYGLETAFGSVTYHSVDLLHTFPKVPSKILLNEEKRLINKVDHVIASSTGVKEHLEAVGFRDILLWENVAHVKTFMKAAVDHRKDQAVFAGNLTPNKIDIQCFQAVLESGVDLALAGPIDIDGTSDSSALSKLINHPQVTYYGNLPLTDLAKLLGESKIGLIPYQINNYTQGVFPMKVYEYLAAGLSVLSTPLPSFSSPIHNVNVILPCEFGAYATKQILEHDSTVAAQSIAAAQDHSWETRILQATDLINEASDKIRAQHGTV